MPKYKIILLPPPRAKPGGNGVTNHEERQFAGLEEARQRAQEMYRNHVQSVGGFRILDAAGGVVDEWRP